jgi:hypothetical protein
MNTVAELCTIFLQEDSELEPIRLRTTLCILSECFWVKGNFILKIPSFLSMAYANYSIKRLGTSFIYSQNYTLQTSEL